MVPWRDEPFPPRHHRILMAGYALVLLADLVSQLKRLAVVGERQPK